MLLSTYRKRLEADLVKWTAAGLIQPGQAGDIRRSVQAEAGGIKLPAVLGMLGGLLLASSVIAFVAANWEALPRVGKLAGILVLIVAALLVAHQFARRGARLAADAGSTAATLIFGAGVALVGQMYHLPADWPAGTAMVGVGALVVAALMRSDGALIIAFVCMIAWLFGLHDDRSPAINWWYLAFFVPALLLALGRSTRVVHQFAVLAAIAWLVLLVGGNAMQEAEFGTHVAYLLFVSVILVAMGLLASDGRLPPLFTECTTGGLLGYVLVIAVQLFRVLEVSAAVPGHAAMRVVVSGVLALAAVGALLAFLPDRKAAVAMAVALVLAMATSIVFWSGLGQTMAGRIMVSALVVLSASSMVITGGLMGQRRVSVAGVLAFGLAVLVLLYKTVGSLLDQSLFFLVAGLMLIGLGAAAHKLLRRMAPQAGSVP